MVKPSGKLAAFALLSLLVCACESAPARMQTEDALGEAADLGAPAILALSCSGCHGPDGGAIASLDGRAPEEIRLPLLRYKNDDDGGSVMHRMMRGYSEADIDAISIYLAETVAE